MNYFLLLQEKCQTMKAKLFLQTDEETCSYGELAKKAQILSANGRGKMGCAGCYSKMSGRNLPSVNAEVNPGCFRQRSAWGC